MPRYNPATIEPKWQTFWEQNKTFKTPRLPEGEKLYVLDMFPYPSGEGLHVGHPEGQTATDIICRYQRMRGKCVLHPMGWDAFGLPAEQHAIKTGTPPRITTQKNIANFRRQEKMLGFSYDWDRELSTTDVEYLRWTQWIFLLLFDTWFDESLQKGRPIGELPVPADVAAAGETAIRRWRDEHRLAYQLEAPVNWCPKLGTVLANEEVKDGLSERGGHPVVRIPLRQWMLRITAYADRLESDLEPLDWSESIKTLQRNWIGRSTGAEVDFFIGTAHQLDGSRPSADAFADWKKARAATGYPRKAGDDVLRIYTTRPDTLYGATYMVLAPEHSAVERLTTADRAADVAAYCEKAARKSDLDRTDLAKEKSGVFSGSYALNPVNGEQTPIWVADYVLMGYGTGAIMAVPAHDTRDFEFAVEYRLPIKAVVDPGDMAENTRDDVLAGKVAFTGLGRAINSGLYNGLTTAEFKAKITADLAARGVAREAVNYKLRDWLFSRQHFWGEPFPILHELDAGGNPTGLIRAVSTEELPVHLPDMPHFKPHGRPDPPLEDAPPDWLYPVIDGVKYKRETNTMPQWAGSCWYYLRFLDPRNDRAFVDPEVERAWMPVDIYIGGAEHAVLHLLYARFWHKVLYDRGMVSTAEPFQRLVNQGMILGEIELTAYQAMDGRYVDASDVTTDDQGRSVLESTGEEVFPSPKKPADVQKIGDQFYIIEPIMRGSYRRSDGSFADASDVTADNQGRSLLKSSGEEVFPSPASPGQVELRGDESLVFQSIKHETDGLRMEHRMVVAKAHKMSKSRNNVITPDSIVEDFSADALRLFEMFMGPLEATKPWSMDGVKGVWGFLERVWRMIVNERAEAIELNSAVRDVEPTVDQNRVLHRTIREVTQDIEKLSFNTAIARMMEFTNFFLKADPRPKMAMERLTQILSPFAPHLCEELWRVLGHADTLAYEPWPAYDEAAIKEDTVEVPVQINGKLRGRVVVPAGADQAMLEAIAKNEETIASQLEGKTIVNTIIKPGRMVNFVLK